nr:uncharacterized mitochondrial protein AtMg00810-like [Tanacetum cinerariifolium]
ESEALMHEKFQMSAMDVRSLNTPMDKENPWGKDGTGKDVDLHLYRSMIGSLMYLTASRPDIMFVVCACARHQVTPKECHLHAVKRIFQYLKSHPKLGLWYPKDFPFDLVAYSDSDYGGATQDRKSTTGGCQFLGRRLISWQRKKQTIVVTSTTEAEYVAAPSCRGQVLWIQNQLLDYGEIPVLSYSPFDLVAYSDSDYSGATQDRKSTTRGCQFLGRRLISWQCKKQTIVATSTTEAEYVAAASCCGQVLWIQNQLLDYGEIPVLSKSEHNFDFYPMVDFVEASPLRIVLFFDIMLIQQGEGSGTPTESHHTPSQEAQPSSHTHISSPSIPTVTSVPTIPIPSVIPSKTTPIRQYTRRARIAQSSALLLVADEPASPVRDDNQGEACPTDSGFIADQDRATIAKSSTLPHDSAPRVTSPAAEEGTMLKERVKILEDKGGVIGDRSGDDAPIKRRSMDEGEPTTKRVSDDTKEMATVLTSMDAATVLASRVVDVPTGSGSIPTASTPAEGSVPTGSEEVPTASLVFTTATVVTPYRRRKGKEVMKVQEQIDAQVARELEEQLAREDQKRAEQIARDAEIARIHAEEELQSWKVKDFKGMTFEEVEAKFNSVCKQMEDFIPMGSKEEAERIKRKGINLRQESTKKQKSSEEITEEAKSPEEVTEEKIKEMMQLVPIEEVYVEAL